MINTNINSYKSVSNDCPLVSVIITTCNRLELLKRALQSVAQQSYNNMEIIIVDGSTNDETKLFLKNKNQFNYIKTQSQHPNILRNTGIRLANGNLLAFLDDDDTWKKEKIERQIKMFEDKSIALCYTGKNIINKNNDIIKYSYQKPKFNSLLNSIMWDNFIGTTSSIMITKEAIEQIGMFDENLSALQDYDLCIRICEKFHVAGIDEPLINYYYNYSNKQVSKIKKNFNLSCKIINKKYTHLKNSKLLKLGLIKLKLKRMVKNIYE